MVKGTVLRHTIVIAGLITVALALFAPMASAQEHGAETAAAANADISLGAGLRALGIAIGAGLCVLGGALATGRAQASIGAGGTGALAEKPELFGRVFILVALPETMVVLGFVLGIMLALSL